MPQAQHYVPQFILRKHSDYVKPNRDDYADKKAYDKVKKKTQRRAKVNALTFANDFTSGQLNTTSCENTFCLADMYDAEIEPALSVLEDRAARIIEAIEKDFYSGKSVTVIARPEKNVLRKFIFIMLYRSRKFHQRFDRQKQDYDSEDRERLFAYMHKKGFATPKEVWLSNIRAFIDVDLDQDNETWFRWLNEQAYPNDVIWFWKNMSISYLCFCTPDAVGEEFLLTENAYGIFEGHSSRVGWTDWHTFAPINPKLMIVTRNLFLGRMLEFPSDCADVVAECQRIIIGLMTSRFKDPAAAKSWLEELPVGRPTRSYPTVTRVVGECSPHKFSSKDTFTFKFFRLPSTFVQRITSLFLEEAMQTETVIYKSAAGLRKAIDSYLELDRPGYKIVAERRPEDGPEIWYTDHDGTTTSSKSTNKPSLFTRGPYLEMLERIVQQLGSDCRAKFIMKAPRSFADMPPISEKFAAKYRLLGFDDLVTTWVYNFKQAGLICQLRFFTDFICRGRKREVRRSMQRACLDLIATLHPRRVWLHLRLVRSFGFCLEAKVMPSHDMMLAKFVAETDGPEDMVIENLTMLRPDQISRALIMRSDPRL